GFYQLAGSGTIIKTGGGRLALGNNQSQFTGDIDVREGALRLDGNLAAGGLATNVITLRPGTVLLHNASGVVPNAIVATDAMISSVGGERMFGGPTTFNG